MSITKEEAAAMVQAAVAAAVEPLQSRISALSSAPPAKEPEVVPEKIFTKDELRDLIDKGQITEAQAEDRLELQREQRIRKAILAEVGGITAQQGVGQTIDEFVALVPELAVKGSKDEQRAKAQFDNLVRRGMPKTPATELTALEMVYGPIDKLRIVKGARTEAESHQDEGGDEQPSRTAPKKMKLSADENRYYGDLIAKGVYKDWDAVNDELKFASTRIREKNGARVH